MKLEFVIATVIGRNPVNSPVEVGSLVYPIKKNRVLYIPGGCLGFLPSTV